MLRGVPAEHRDVAVRALELVEGAVERWEVVMTDFLEPPQAAAVTLCVGRLADAEARPWGGYEHAERVRMRLGRPEVLDNASPDERGVALLVVDGSFLFDAATHRDFLGACLGTGIERNRCVRSPALAGPAARLRAFSLPADALSHSVGDIVVQQERGAHILTTPEMALYLSTSLSQVRSVRVQSTVQPLSALKVTTPKADTVRSVEASLRLDAIASAGFRTSRGKMAESIEAGDVRLNWRKEGIKTSTVVKTGDVISIRGKGRLTVGEVGVTKKDRFSVELHRLL